MHLPSFPPFLLNLCQFLDWENGDIDNNLSRKLAKPSHQAELKLLMLREVFTHQISPDFYIVH